MSDDSAAQWYVVKMVAHEPVVEAIAKTQAAIDGLKGQTVTINIEGDGMFERFTDRARRVVVLAQEEARMLKHNYIGTEHILLGLVHEGEGVAAQALTASGIDLAECRKQVEELVSTGQQAPSGHIPFTPRGKKVMELALREALQVGHNYVGTEHLLLGLIRETEGVGAQVLKAMGAELNAVRIRVLDILATTPRETPAKTTPRTSAVAKSPHNGPLQQYGLDLVKRAIDWGEVVSFEAVRTERAAYGSPTDSATGQLWADPHPSGDVTETITIHWRRRETA